MCRSLVIFLLATLVATGLSSADDAATDTANPAIRERVVMRRLNRTEYENTIRDLLKIEIDVKDLLPLDSSAGGFDNVGDAMHVSSFLMERYLEAADKALNVAIVNLPQPPVVSKRYSLKDERQVKISEESVFLPRDDSLVMFSSSAWNSITLSQFYPPDRGLYRMRISAYGFQSGGNPVTFRIDAGPMLMGTRNDLVGYFDVPCDVPTVIEFQRHFEARNHIRISPYGLATAHVLNKIGAEKYDGPGLGVEWVDVEGPMFDTWPPESHRRIFGDLEQGPAPNRNYSNRVEVVSREPMTDADRILRDFARRAFRRPVPASDIDPVLRLVQAKLDEGRSFEQAVRVGLMAILVSPEFLFLQEGPGQLDDFAVASRLSYFLWSTMPDEELIGLAEKGLLVGDGDKKVLHEQVERMLNDPRSSQFVTNFTGQWLQLRDIDFTEPSHLLYPEFDDLLKVSMVREAELFFTELLTNDLSLTNLIASDFTMLNGRLARHYGIPLITAPASADLPSALPRGSAEFFPTPLPPDSHRGGVLTMASVLKVTANGTLTSPVTRGVFVLDKIMGQPPSPPPESVAALEPDVRGATTIREQLAKHREMESCASCHDDIDPPGFALESFDVIGGWREHYRTTGNGEAVEVDGRHMPYHRGKKIDPSAVLSDERAFQDIDELKLLLLADKDLLARSLTTKLLTYATGAEPLLADQSEVDAIVVKVREKNYGLRSLIHEIVASDLFLSK